MTIIFQPVPRTLIMGVAYMQVRPMCENIWYERPLSGDTALYNDVQFTHCERPPLI